MLSRMRPRGAADRLDPSHVDRGAVAVVVAVVATLIFALGAIVIDLGLAQDNRRQAQNAADSAALAAATYLSRLPSPAAGVGQAQQVANRYAVANGWAPGASSVTVDLAQSLVTVQLAPVQSARLFAGVLGAGTPRVSARAVATYADTGGVDCALCVLDLLAGQVGGVNVSGGGSLAAGRITFNNAQGGITVTGGGGIGFVQSWNGNGALNPAPRTIPAFQDPWASIPRPVLPGPPRTGSGTCTEGNYRDISGCTAFQPGIYVVTGDLKLTGQESLVANGVLFYLTCGTASGAPRQCSQGEDGADFDLAGGGAVRMTPYTNASSPWSGFTYVSDPNNAGQQKWTGNGNFTVTGRVYVPNTATTGGLSLRGNGTMTIGGPVVAGYLETRGNKDQVTVNGPNVAAPATNPVSTRLRD